MRYAVDVLCIVKATASFARWTFVGTCGMVFCSICTHIHMYTVCVFLICRVWWSCGYRRRNLRCVRASNKDRMECAFGPSKSATFTHLTRRTHSHMHTYTRTHMGNRTKRFFLLYIIMEHHHHHRHHLRRRHLK